METPSHIASALWLDEEGLSSDWRGYTAPVAQVLGELRRVINRRW
jgi:hypothetical protein